MAQKRAAHNVVVFYADDIFEFFTPGGLKGMKGGSNCGEKGLLSAE